jgi:hypothetical protein
MLFTEYQKKNMKLTHCILTGNQFENSIEIDEITESILSYTYPSVGLVKIAIPTLLTFINNREYKHPILAGICRNAYEKSIELPVINQDLINSLSNITYPKAFKEKTKHFLKFIYEKGGNDFKTFDINNNRDYPICYCENEEELSRILDYLEENYLVKWDSKMAMARNFCIYLKLQLTDYGIEEVEKDLPKIPMIGLVNQKITTGNEEVDDKINHAKKLFLEEPQTIDRMRSACETLSYVLEPLRQNVKQYFKTKDTEDFFNIVNNFDIRHNKDTTKEIEHPEQMDWIFYSLLNTINTYTKLKSRLEK